MDRHCHISQCVPSGPWLIASCNRNTNVLRGLVLWKAKEPLLQHRPCRFKIFEAEEYSLLLSNLIQVFKKERCQNRYWFTDERHFVFIGQLFRQIGSPLAGLSFQ